MQSKRWQRVAYPYYQDIGGVWWTLNPQTGWVVATGSRALAHVLSRA